MQTGRCQCGEIRYKITDEPFALYICHCKECQKQSASAFGITVEVTRVGFSVTQGTPKYWSRAINAIHVRVTRKLPDIIIPDHAKQFPED